MHGYAAKPDTITSLLTALDLKFPAVAAHSRRAAVYATRLASQYGMARRAVEVIREGALLHDVGKLLVPDHVLQQASPLSEDDWEDLRIHPDLGIELLSRAGVDPDVCAIVLHHHERYDGLGYPDGLAGREIPWAVRIVTVADAFDALTSERSYRGRMSTAGALACIARAAGTRFCPAVVSALLSLPDRLLQAHAEQAESPFLPDGCAVPVPEAMSHSWTPALS